VPFGLVRLKNFLKALLKNRLAATGVTLLSLFIFVAVAAPLLTPYSPSANIVSGKLNPPGWVTNVFGSAGYSQNIQFSPLSVNQTGAGLTVTKSGQTDYSVDLSISSPVQSGTIQVVETLSYPYSGSPKTIFGDASIDTTRNNNPFNLTTFVERVAPDKWTYQALYKVQINSTGAWRPVPTIDSTQLIFNNHLGLGESFDAASFIFAPRPAEYHFVMQITVPSGFSGDIQVTKFFMQLFGNTWGPLGTDNLGHDIYTQLLYGARLSLIVGLVATGIGVGLGLLVGLMAGYLGKIVDEVLMRFTDMLLVIPQLPLLIVLVATIGPSLLNIILFLGFFGWMGFARVIRAQVLSLRERPFIEAAKASGAGPGYITVRHIFPNIVSLTYVSLALSVPAAIVGEAALSFLGLGDPTTITWGQMLGGADQVGFSTGLAWWWILPPGISIALLSLSFVLLGYAMDEMFNPRLRRRR